MARKIGDNPEPDQCTTDTPGLAHYYESATAEEVKAKAIAANPDLRAAPEEIDRYIHRDEAGRYYLDKSCAQIRALAVALAQDDFTKYRAKGDSEVTKAVSRSESQDLLHDIKSATRAFNQNMSWINVYTSELTNQADNDPLLAAGAGIFFAIASIPTAVFGNTPFLDTAGGAIQIAKNLPNVKMLRYLDKIKLLTGLSRMAQGLERLVIETKTQIQIKEDRGLSPETLDCLAKEGLVSQLNLKKLAVVMSASLAALGALSAVIYHLKQSFDQAELAELEKQAKARAEESASPDLKAEDPQPEDAGDTDVEDSQGPTDEYWIELLVQQHINREVSALNADLTSDQSIALREVLEKIKSHDYKGAEKLYNTYAEENCGQSGVSDPAYCLDPRAQKSLKDIFEASDAVLWLKENSMALLAVGAGSMLFSMLASGDSIVGGGESIYQRWIRKPAWKSYWDNIDERATEKADSILERAEEVERTKQCFPDPVAEAEAAAAAEASRTAAANPAPAAVPGVPVPVPVGPIAPPSPSNDPEPATAQDGPTPAMAFSIPGGMAIPEISIPYEFSAAEFFGRGGEWRLSPAYSPVRGGTFFGAGEPPPMEVKVYNMARMTGAPTAESLAPGGAGSGKASGSTAAPTESFGARAGQMAKGVVLYTGGYVLINGAMLYFNTPQELTDYVNGVYGAAGLVAMAKNPALMAYIPSGLLGAEIASDLTYEAIESTGLSTEAKAFAHGATQVVGGGGAVVGTLYVASRLGMSTPVTAVVSLACLEIYHGYKRHQSLEKARAEFLAMAADYEGVPDLFASLERELPQILNSGFDAVDMTRLNEIMQSPYYADIMTGMGWYFYERYFKSFVNDVLPGVESLTIGGSPDSSVAENYKTIRKSFGAEIYLLGLQMRCSSAKDVFRTFSQNLKVPMTEANYEALRAAVRAPKNAEALKEHGPVLVEKLIDLWLGNVGYASGTYAVATWLASSSDQWAKRKETGVAYGTKIAQLKSWILNPSAMRFEDEQFAKMKQASDAGRVATLEKRLDAKVAAGEMTDAKAEQIERDAIMSGAHIPQTLRPRTAAEIEAGQKHYSWMVSKYVDGMTGAFEEEFWSGDSTNGMVGELAGKIRLLKRDGDVGKGDITPGVFVTMLWRWLDDVQQHLHSRESAGWGQTAVWGGHMDAEEIRAANDLLELLRAKLNEYEKSGDPVLLGNSTSHIAPNKNTIFDVMGRIDLLVSENSRW